MSFRPEKVANEIKKILAQPVVDISNGIKAGFATLTAVRISKDLQNAKIYISLFGKDSKPGALISELESQKGELRHKLGKELRLRAVPELKFFLDDTLDQIEHIQNILSTVKSDSNSEE
ncbi:30S ribosome-binding factor RbfA [Candidatus Kapaibacterium sp.]